MIEKNESVWPKRILPLKTGKLFIDGVEVTDPETLKKFEPINAWMDFNLLIKYLGIKPAQLI
ncbi:hypothetical protein AGMMS49546_28180 [Spirochaetia bacterium]|nr:hypothetical protein AGMMS49546_28180 [Spirochaetia bacterium]